LFKGGVPFITLSEALPQDQVVRGTISFFSLISLVLVKSEGGQFLEFSLIIVFIFILGG